MARRGHGEGSIYQRKDGRWAASITLENRKRKTFYGKTRKEVQEQLKIALHEQQQGTLATGAKQTMKQFLEQWIEEVHRPAVKESSYATYRFWLDKHILPALGHISLQKLTPQHIQSFYTRLLKGGISARSIRSVHALLHKALEHAVRWRLVGRNICKDVSMPRPARHEVQPLTKEQAHKLLEVAKGHGLEALITVAVTTGMRRGELFALHWQDVDFDDRSIQVQRTVSRVPKVGYVEYEPKTQRSRRKVVFPPFVLEVLKRHRAQQLEMRLKASAWEDRDLVFCNTHGGYLHPTHSVVEFQKLLAAAGLPKIRFHDLRHSAATILLSMGVHPKVVQELLGHSQIGMTMDTYSHILPSMQRDAMDKWG
jgi:integrase